MEAADAGTVVVVVIVIGIIRVAAATAGRVGRGGILFLSNFHIGCDYRLGAAGIVGQRTQQIAVFIGFINDGIRLHSGVVGRLCGGGFHSRGTFFTR